MSDAPVDRLKPTKATAILSEFTEPTYAHGEHTAEPSEPPKAVQPLANSEESDDIHATYAEFREWCEDKRTRWPTSLVEFLGYSEAMLAWDIGDSFPSAGGKTIKDYSWVPSVLCDIFYSHLKPEAKLNILEYFLSLLSVLILSDWSGDGSRAQVYRDLLLRVVAPSQSDCSRKPDFLGALDPADAPDTNPNPGSELEQISLVRDLRHELYLHTRDPR